jgi:hypothetical protein
MWRKQTAFKEVQKNQSKSNDMIQDVDIAKGTFLQVADEAKHRKIKSGTWRGQHNASPITRSNSQSSSLT